jgi:hypothetical protein
VNTNAQLTYPAVGKGPFPGVLLIHGSGANDENGTLGFVLKNGPKPLTPLWQIANICRKEDLQCSDMIRGVLVQILRLITTYGEIQHLLI